MRRPARIASVRVRITVLTTAVLAIGLLIATVVLLSALRHSLLDSQAGSGPRRAAELAALASEQPLANPLPAIDSDPPTVLQIIGTDGSVVAASSELQGAGPLLAATARGRHTLVDVPGLGGGSWLAEPTPATIGGRAVTLIVLTSLAGYDRGFHLLRNSLLVTVPVLLVLVAGLVWWVVGRSLRTVESMRQEVARITAQRLDRRVRASGDDEVGRLAGTLNDMLERLQSARDGQRRFVADASHELRTPIANIRAALEVATTHPERADWPSVADDVLRQDARMERLTTDLLALARAEAGPRAVGAGTRVDLAGVIEDELRRAVPDGRRLVAGGPVPHVEVHGDREQLARVLANLVDNALRHAGRQVTVSLTRGTTSAELRVVDDGPGVAVEHRESVFDPFVRLDPHRTRAEGGTGLGLAIVREVVRSHGGTVEITGDRPGATFVVRLPLAAGGPLPRS